MRLGVVGMLPGFATYAQEMATPEEGESAVAEALPENADADEDATAVRPNDGEPLSADAEDAGEGIDAQSGSLDDSSGSIETDLETREIRVWNIHRKTLPLCSQRIFQLLHGDSSFDSNRHVARWIIDHAV